MLIRNLQKIPVPGHQRHFHAIRRGLPGQGSQNVICLQPLLLHNHHIHGPQYVLHHRHLLPQFLWHGLPGTFIRFIHQMSEGGGMYVESHRQIIRLFLFQNFKHNIQKAINRVGVQSRGIGQIRHAVKRPVQNAVSIDQYKFLVSHHILLPFFLTIFRHTRLQPPVPFPLSHGAGRLSQAEGTVTIISRSPLRQAGMPLSVP